MKRKVSSLLVIIMVLNLVGIFATMLPVATLAADAQVIYQEDFEGYADTSALQAKSGWVCGVPPATAQTLGTDSTKYIALKPGRNTNGAYAQVTFKPIPITAAGGNSPGKNIKIVAQYRIQRSIFMNGNSIWAGFGDSTSEKLGVATGSRVDNAGDGASTGVYFYYGTAKNTGQVGAPRLAEGDNTQATTPWVKIRYEITVTDLNGNYVTPSVFAYVNDSPTGIDCKALLNPVDSINSLRMATSSGFLTLNIDDIKVEVVSDDKPIAPTTTATPTPMPTAPAAQNYSQTFSDVPTTYWAFGYIAELVKRNVVSGYPDGNFYPDKTVSRAEFAKIMTVTAGLPIKTTGQSSFSDVLATDWCSPYIETAKDYLTGIPAGGTVYAPNTAALREDIAVALVKLKGYDTKTVDLGKLHNMFTDYNSISTAARPYIAVAVDKGLLAGYPDGTFGGQNTITRAEAAALLWRAYP